MGRSIFVLFTLLKFYFTPKPPTITFPSKPNTYTPLHNLIHYNNKATSKNPSLESPPPSRNFTSQIQNLRFSWTVDLPGTLRVPRNVPFFADPQFPLPFSPSLFSRAYIPLLLHYRHSWPRCTTGRVNVFERVGRVSGFRLVDFTVRSRSAEDFEPLIPFPLSLAAHVFLANSAPTRFRGFFHPPERTPVFDNRFDQFNAKSRPEWFFFLVLLFAYLCCFRSVESSLVFYRKVVLFVIFFFKLDFLCKR